MSTLDWIGTAVGLGIAGWALVCAWMLFTRRISPGPAVGYSVSAALLLGVAAVGIVVGNISPVSAWFGLGAAAARNVRVAADLILALGLTQNFSARKRLRASRPDDDGTLSLRS